MFCPYCQKIFTRIVKLDLNENDIEKGHILQKYYGYYECQKEKCGAWYRGRCRYNERRN